MASSKKSLTDISQMKTRIKELEDQVSSYKRRLEELRKAKNTTITKTEQKVLEVNAPNLGQRSGESRITDLQRQLDEATRRHEAERRTLNKQHQAALDTLTRRHHEELAVTAADTAKHADKSAPCDHLPHISRLEATVLTLEDTNTALLVENRQLEERVEGLVSELSVKEATWCENEERLNMKLKRQWGEKYQEWMAETEKKIDELQTANNFLRGYLKKHEPGD